MRASALACALALALASCGDDPAAPDGQAAGTTPAAPALGPVVTEAIAALEAELAASDPTPAPPDGAAVDAAREPTLGLVEALATSSERGPMRRAMIEELVQPGEAIVPHLAALLADRGADPEQRKVAAEALGTLDSIAGTDALLARLETSRTEVDPESWLIAQCAWRLSDTTQDWIVPRVLLCLRYEQDHESVLWLADTLAGFGNYSGMEGLRVIMGGESETRERAAGLYAKLSGETPGFTEGAWAQGLDLPAPEPSPRLLLETWRRIGALSEWQLRGVDDARFVLSRSGSYAAGLLAQALTDDDVYVRVHSAQCLERMGPRGWPAGDALVRALDDPRVAPAAAAALGAIGDRVMGLHTMDGDIGTVLAGRLGVTQALELRVAAARALGQLESHASSAELIALASDEAETIDLRLAAAGAVVRTAPLTEAEPVARFLEQLLDSNAVEVTEVRAALDAWALRLQEPDEQEP